MGSSSLGSGQRFSEFVKEWQTHYAEPHDLTSSSLSPMLDVLVKGLGTHRWSTSPERRFRLNAG